MNDTMKAIAAQQSGGPDVLQPADVEIPRPGSGQVVVRTAATGVNFIETYQREGVYSVAHPFTPGSEGADHDAAALPLQGLTAHYLVRSTFELGPEHTAVITAASGGVGGLAIQLMKRIGATVIALTSTAEKAATARELGADHVLGYDGFADKVRELTDGRGADVVYDSVGKSTFDESLKATRVRGTVVLFGGSRLALAGAHGRRGGRGPEGAGGWHLPARRGRTGPCGPGIPRHTGQAAVAAVIRSACVSIEGAHAPHRARNGQQ